MPMDSATGSTPKLCAIAGTAVAMTVPSRFSMKNAAATRKATGDAAVGAAAAGVEAALLGITRIVEAAPRARRETRPRPWRAKRINVAVNRYEAASA